MGISDALGMEKFKGVEAPAKSRDGKLLLPPGKQTERDSAFH